MTVKELIEKLQEYPEGMEVYIDLEDARTYSTANEIELCDGLLFITE